jgi:hypothetical protein
MSSLGVTLAFIQRHAVFGISWVYITFGVIGCFLNICLFSRKQFRTISCCTCKSASFCLSVGASLLFISPDFLAAAIVMFMQLILYSIPNIYGFYYANPLTYLQLFCKIRMFTIQVTAFTYRWAYAAASVDRYILSSPHARLRRLGTVNIAYHVLGCMIVTWSVSSVYIPLVFDIKGRSCAVAVDNVWPVFVSVWSLVVGSFAPAIIMVTFTLLIRKNLAEKRQRREGLLTQLPSNNSGEHLQRRRDQQALKMLFAQIVIYLIVSIPWNLYSINTIVSSFITNKTADRIAVEGFITVIAGALAFLFPALSFYLYTLTSSMFRRELLTMARSAVHGEFLNRNRRIEPTTGSNSQRTTTLK